MAFNLLTLVVVIFCITLFVSGQTSGSVGMTIQNSDPSIVYSPTFCQATDDDDNACLGAWCGNL